MKKAGTKASARLFVILLLLAAFSGCLYLWRSWAMQGLGLPLDDAWIHQTYARNLARAGQWAFIVGQPSAGSTSPLWTVLLALGVLVGMRGLVWTYVIGGILVALCGWVGALWVGAQDRFRWNWALLAGALIVLEWHLAWSAVSGMEIPALALLALLAVRSLERETRNPLLLGMLIGLGAWIRPDALTLVLPLLVVILVEDHAHAGRLARRLLLAAGGLALLLLPYLIFNRSLSGSFWPTTYFAKQAEYAVLRETSLFGRMMEQAIQPLVGVGISVLPGVILDTVHWVRKKAWVKLAGLLWVGAFLGAYALRLPVTYQHGRYVMPVIPVLLVLGVRGMMNWADWSSRIFWRRLVSRLWLLCTLGVLVSFWIAGSVAYSRDVGLIETEMVATAEWVAENTEPDALVAAHDIGALGYFGQRRLLDLAGLVTPQVIPILRDERALEEYLDAAGVDYLMTFPAWYPSLVEKGTLIHSSEGRFSPAAGGENMAVYRWRGASVAP
jgi:arabinofuranosyltransferase